MDAQEIFDTVARRHLSPAVLKEFEE